MTNPDREELGKLADALEQVLKVASAARRNEKSMPVWADDVKAMQDAVTALRRLASSEDGVKVRELEWSQSPPPAHEHEPFVYWAAGLGGHYRAERDGLLWMAHDAFVWEQHPTQDAAKAAAQRDYEVRILSALDM